MLIGYGGFTTHRTVYAGVPYTGTNKPQNSFFKSTNLPTCAFRQ